MHVMHIIKFTMRYYWIWSFFIRFVVRYALKQIAACCKVSAVSGHHAWSGSVLSGSVLISPEPSGGYISVFIRSRFASS